jgi:hypothetical protein
MTTIRTGEKLSRVIPVLDAAYAAVAITSGWSARVQVRANPTSTVVIKEWSTADGTAELVTGAAGGVRILATAAETTAWLFAWPAGPLSWDVRLVDTAGEPHILPLGAVALDTHVTRP